MNTILLKLLSWITGMKFLGPVGSYIRGSKRLIGGLSIVVYVLINLAEEAFGCGPLCGDIGEAIKKVLEILGVTLLSFGVADQAVKEKLTKHRLPH